MLFSLYVAGIEKIIPGECDIGMFPDDIALWCSSPDVSHVESTVSSTLTEWNPFHVNVPGNEVADFLAKRGCSGIATTDYALAYREMYSLVKIKDKQVWMALPHQPGISRKSPGRALEFGGDRNDETAVSRMLSGHLKCMTFESGRKVFQTCPKCHLLLAFSEHILDCLVLALKDVHTSPLLVLDFARVNGLMDLI
ncbi:RNase H domain-containing protein [Trichonephila clavipes]|nr:RNase H domain-containing protein [Trichonephila clavipes]